MKTCADLLGPELAAHTVLIPDAPYAVLALRGPDVADFLQRLCSQEVTTMPVGAARPAAFLTPKGRLESLAWVGRDATGWWVETQAHEVAKVGALLERYHFAEKLTLEAAAQGWSCQMALGPEACPDAARGGRVRALDAGVEFTGECRGLRWARWHGPEAKRPAPAWPLAGPEAWSLRRIAAGIPWMGVDADASTLAMEAGIDDHLSTTKGCYTGQEIVARIHTYGHVNRRLCRLMIDGTGAVPPGTVIEDEAGIAVGRVMSSAGIPGVDRRVALGFLPRELSEEQTALALASGERVRVVG